jgi:hypothetical protein
MTKLRKVIIRNRKRSSACHWLEIWYSVESAAHVDIWTRTSDRHLSYNTEHGPNTEQQILRLLNDPTIATYNYYNFKNTLHITLRQS